MKSIPIRKIKPASRATPNFNIRKVSDLVANGDMVQELHRHNFYFLLALKKGQGHHEIDFTNYQVKDHSVFILRPGQVHKLELKKNCTGYLLAFNKEFYHPVGSKSAERFRAISHNNYYNTGLELSKDLFTILRIIYREFYDQKNGYTEAINAALDLFFIALQRQIKEEKETKFNGNGYPQQRFGEFIELLEKHMADHKQLKFYCEQMNLSAFQLNGITRSSVGKNASVLINEQVILEAKRQLLATTGQVKDIAYDLGFEDVSYFIRFFRKHTGQTPDAFRQSSK